MYQCVYALVVDGVAECNRRKHFGDCEDYIPCRHENLDHECVVGLPDLYESASCGMW